jgi:very-short-patch-repair endonuclease
MRSRELTRLWRGDYAQLPSTDVSNHGRAVRLAAAALAPGAVVCGASAARELGLDVPAAWCEEIAVSPAVTQIRPRPGLAVRARTVPRAQQRSLRGLIVTSLARTVVDIAASRPRAAAQWVVDQALARGVSRDEITGLVERGQRGARRVRQRVAQGDRRCESALESVIRLMLLDAGVPAFETQHEVRLPDGRLARLDFAWPERRVLLEADGIGWHGAPRPLHEDRARQNALTVAAWRPVRVTWADSYEPWRPLAHLRALLTSPPLGAGRRD